MGGMGKLLLEYTERKGDDVLQGVYGICEVQDMRMWGGLVL